MSSQRLSQMMDEYTGPIGLYAHLAQRSKVAPIMLRRNLSYRRDAYEAERRRINDEIPKSDKADASQDDGKERAAEGDAMVDGAYSGAKIDAADDAAHSAGGGGSGSGGKRALDGDQPCSRRSMHAVKKTAVVFRLRYQEGQQESVHRVPELRCPWCDMTCGKLESIMWHLQASHDRFSYALDKSLAIPEIYINVKASNSTEELNKSLAPHSDFSFLSARRGGGALISSLSQLLACEDDAGNDSGTDGANKKRKKGNDMVSTSSNGSKGKQALQTKPCAKPKIKGKRGARMGAEKKGLAERQLFRSQTCLPIDVNDQMDMDYDSDDDVDDEWQLAQAERLMDEFEDVTAKEKAFMKLWNRFVHRHAILADFQVSVACTTFAKHFGPELLRQGLRDELLFHMFALWDFNLLDQFNIRTCLGIVDKCAEGVTESSTGKTGASGSTSHAGPSGA